MIRLSIAQRLSVMFAVVAAVIFSVLAVALYNVSADAVRRQIQGELYFQHTLLDPMIKQRTAAQWDYVRGKLDSLSEVEGRFRYWLLAEDARYRHGEPIARRSTAWRGKDGFKVVKDEQGKPWGVLARDIPAYHDRPAVSLVVAMDCTAYLKTKNVIQQFLALACALGILLVALFGYWIARLGLEPVRRLSSQANALPPDDPRKRLDTGRLPPEILELAASFNNALSRRETAWRQLEGFNADVAHELRTPLTNLIGQTQVALAHPRDSRELQELLASNLEEFERMSSIVNDMLFLSRADSGQRAAELSEVSLREEALKTMEYLEPSFAQRNLAVSLEGDQVARVDKRLFHRALANLLANSARYAHAGSQVRVKIAREGDSVKVAVCDEGDPIPPAQQARLFERFYRGDAARSGSEAHHGLGLSIVRAIAAMHGGDVFVSSRDGVNTFGFSLPLQG
ncbi:heavy metal sensor histidine kinase [Orrella sp. JC864]|uniref:heavy metal sensor histidine kinase n=1 Tax=Orrella sp. JC864 TaxID=3120298 RepID=UPI00300AC892